MLKIKFSHRYHKLITCGIDSGTKVMLLEVLPVNLEDLHPVFLDYDTDEGLYPLPKKGKYLLLLFISASGIFTTIRRQTPEKEAYYREHIADTFEVVIAAAV